jgi:hypothetical protein
VPVLSFAWLKFVLHMCVGLMGCDQGWGVRDNKEKGGANHANGAVDSRHRTGVKGYLHPCIKGHYSK